MIWAMNAQGVKNENHLEQLFQSDRFIAQVKLDGMRAVVHVTASGLRIYSRSAGVADPSRPLEKTSALPHLAALVFPELIGTVLDCEILIPGKDSAEIAGMIHRKQPSSGQSKVHLFIFDVLMIRGERITNRSLKQRLAELLEISTKVDSEYIHFLSYAVTTAQKRSLYNRVIATGGEGIMLKNLDAPYIEGERPSNNWFKAKRSATYDCVVIGFSKGRGKYNTLIGAVRFGQYVDGKLVELGQASGMTDEVRQEMSINPKKFLGKVVIIKGMERLKSGAIRHPQFAGMHEEKHPLQCIWYRNEQ